MQDEGAIWPRFVTCIVKAITDASGRPAMSATEFFFQDSFQPPQGLRDRMLLAIGDPLGIVGVPWTPTSLIIDFTEEVGGRLP